MCKSLGTQTAAAADHQRINLLLLAQKSALELLGILHFCGFSCVWTGFCSGFRAEAGVSWCGRGHDSPPRPRQAEAPGESLVFWEPADSASGWVETHEDGKDEPVAERRTQHVCSFIQTQSTSTLEAPWVSTSASSTSTPGPCSHQPSWAWSSPTAQVWRSSSP